MSSSNSTEPFSLVAGVGQGVPPTSLPPSWGFKAPYAAAYVGTLIVVDVVLNALFLAGVVRAYRRRLRAGQTVLVNLAAVDLAAGVAYLPTLLAALLAPHPRHCRLLCAVLPALERGLVAATVWSAALVSLDRYMFIVKHNSYRSSMTLRRSAAGIVTVWVLGVLFGATSVLLSSHHVTPAGACVCHVDMDFYGIFALVYSAGFITVAFILPTTLMLVFYGFVIRVAYRRTAHRGKNPFRLGKKSRVTVQPESRDSVFAALPPGRATSVHVEQTRDSNSVRLYQVKAARILFAIVLVYLLCVTPYFVCSMGMSAGHWTSDGLPHVTHVISVLLLYTNSACNPLFYGLANRRLRRALVDLFRTCCRQNMVLCDCERRPWTRSNSKVSVLGDSSGSSRRDSHSSDVSALSALSRDGFVSRDLLDMYNQRDVTERETPTPAHFQRTKPDREKMPPPTQNSLQSDEMTPSPPCANRTRRPSSTSDTGSVEDLSSDSRCSSPDLTSEPHYGATDFAVPIRRPLVVTESRRSLILRQIADAAMLYASQGTEEGDQECSLPGSTSPDQAECTATKKLLPRSGGQHSCMSNIA